MKCNFCKTETTESELKNGKCPLCGWTVIRASAKVTFDLAKYDGFVIVEGECGDPHKGCGIFAKYYRHILRVYSEKAADIVYQLSFDKVNWVDSLSFKLCCRSEEDMKWLKSLIKSVGIKGK